MHNVLGRPLVALLALTLFGTHGTPAAGATRSVTHSADDFLAGELDGLALDAQGRLAPAPVRRESHPTSSLYGWSLTLDARGRLIVGSGDEGKLYRMEKDELQEWVDTLAYEILALLPFEGALLAGSSPDGVIYRVGDDGKAEIALDLPQQSVWSLATGSRAGTWLAGTGPGAQLFRGGRGVEAGEVLHRVPATNLTELLRDAQGLWIGTSGPGLVLRIQGDDTTSPRLLYEAPQGEIAGLVADGEDGVYVLSVNAIEGERAGSRLARLGPAGQLDVVWEGSEVLVSLARRDDGSFLVGEARTGRVLHLDAEGRMGLWVELDGGDPLALLEDGDRTWVATGNLGVVYELLPGEGDEGTWTSPVVTTRGAERWGRIWAEGWGDAIEVSARSGVRARPDATWSDWSDFRPTGSPLDVPPAPYLQYRLQLRRSSVSAVHLAWAERNVAPKINYVRVEDAGGDLVRNGGASTPLAQRFESGLEVEYSIGATPQRAEPDQAAWVRGIRTLHWEGVDANDDALRYEVAVRAMPDGEWYVLTEEHRERVLAWDTSAFADGPYRVRVTASDATSHPEGEGRSASLESAVVRVDNHAPAIERVDVKDGRTRVRARDEVSPIAEAHWRDDQGEWVPLAPIDGVIDAPMEDFALPTTMRAGTRVWIRVVDRAGNAVVHEHRIEAPR